MANYMLVYKGEATDMSEMTPEQGQAVMAAWGVWMEKVGSALLGCGNAVWSVSLDRRRRHVRLCASVNRLLDHRGRRHGYRSIAH